MQSISQNRPNRHCLWKVSNQFNLVRPRVIYGSQEIISDIQRTHPTIRKSLYMILPYTSKHGNKKIFISGNLHFSDSFLLGGVKDHRLFLFKPEKTTTLDGYFINQKLQFRGYLPKLSRYKEQEVSISGRFYHQSSNDHILYVLDYFSFIRVLEC